MAFKEQSDPIKDLKIGVKYNIKSISDLDELNIDDLKYIIDAIADDDKKRLNKVAYGGRLLSEYDFVVLSMIHGMFDRRCRHLAEEERHNGALEWMKKYYTTSKSK